MKATLVTTRANQFGGVLGTAYRQAGGPPFSSIIVLPERDDLSWTVREQAYAAWKMFGLRGTLRMLRYRFAGSLLSPAERDLGIGTQWLDSLSSGETQLVALDDINSSQSAARIQELTPDVLVSIGTPTILRRHVLEIPTWGSVNLHNGRLPRYRGHFATFWEKLYDEEWGYVSLHEMVAQVDAGRMLATARIPLREVETMLDAVLQKKRLGGQLLADLMRDVAAGRDVRQAPSVMDGTSADEPGYFGWPKIDDLRTVLEHFPQSSLKRSWSMHVWLIHLGELLPIDGNPRLFRYGLLAQMLSESGHRVTRWAPTFVHATKTYRAQADCRIDVDDNYSIELLHVPGYRRHIGPRRLLFHRGMVQAFRRQSEVVDRPDLIVCAMPTPEMCAAAVEYGEREGIPVMLDIRDLWPDLFIDLMPNLLKPVLRLATQPVRRLNRTTFAKADALIGISPGFLEWALDQAGRPQQPNDRVCPMGHRRTVPSDDELSQAKQRWSDRGVKDDGTFRCTFTGTIGHLFDLETVIGAVHQYNRQGDQGIQFVICGEGAKLNHYKKLAGSLPNVVFPGWVQAHDVVALYEMSSLGLAPYLQTIQTTYPNKVVDYLSRGLPVVATRSGELATLVESRNVGAAYTESDRGNLCHVIDRIRSDANLRAEWRVNALALYDDEFDAGKVYANFIEYLESMCRQPVSRMRACA